MKKKKKKISLKKLVKKTLNDDFDDGICLSCCFCKNTEENSILMGGPIAYICDECIHRYAKELDKNALDNGLRNQKGKVSEKRYC